MRMQFVKKKQEVDDIWSFFFQPSQPFNWIAGQSIRLEIPRPTFGIDERRFTISSAPSENIVRITTRLSASSFKQSLASLSPGAQITGASVDGNFIWLDGPKIFAAAGIGITPFRSMLIEAKAQNRTIDTALIQGSSDKAAVFNSELRAIARQDESFKVHRIKGRINAGHITAVPQWQTSCVFISGPERLVSELSRALLEAGLAENKIKLDLFTGYRG